MKTHKIIIDGQEYEQIIGLFAQACECGAITVSHQTGNKCSVSMPRNLFEQHFPKMEVEKDLNTMYGCNHCVNHWGIDLCLCGSGEPFESCDGGLPECGHPQQFITDLEKEYVPNYKF